MTTGNNDIIEKDKYIKELESLLSLKTSQIEESEQSVLKLKKEINELKKIPSHDKVLESGISETSNVVTSSKDILKNVLNHLPVFMSKLNPRELLKSGLFDEQWYLEYYPDVKRSGIPAAKHFLKYGLQEGRLPSKNHLILGNKSASPISVTGISNFKA